MKYISLIFLFISSITIYLEARIGCRDNSWHLQKKYYDYKEDHAVVCLCPCPEKMGRCSKCQHYHEAKPWTIIKNNKPKQGAKKYLFNHNMQAVVKKLVNRYYQSTHLSKKI